jgi:hypothetical protein
MAEKRKRLEATAFGDEAKAEETCRRLIETFSSGRQVSGGDGNVIGGTGRFAQLHAECRTRDNHYYNAAAADPVFLPPFEKMPTFQSDILRNTYSKGRARMLEHDPVIRVIPGRDIQKQRDAANAIERFFNDGYREIEEKRGYRIQGHLFHGQAVHYAGVLHWRHSGDWVDMPEREEVDEVDATETERFMAVEAEDDGEAVAVEEESYTETVTAKYRETEQSRLERYKRAKAEAPFPWLMDVPRSDTFAFAEDKTLKNGMAITITVESVGFMDYAFALMDKDDLAISVNEEERKILIYEEQDRPEGYDPSGNDSQVWGNLRVAYIETRNEWYEMVSHSEGGTWTLAKSGKHDGEMPRYVLAKAGENNHPDPLYRWYPWMLGLFRTKPSYDYERSLGRIIAEQAALPRYWIEYANGTYALNDDGSRRVFSENSAEANSLPEGAQLKSVNIQLNPAYVQFMEQSKLDTETAAPETGFVEIGASTQPHTLVMAQSQANTEIADLKTEQARAIRIAFQNILDCYANWAEDGDPMCVLDSNDRVIEIEADVLRRLTVEVDIEPNSGAQQIAKDEYLRTKLNDPKVMYPTREYLEDTGVQDPDAQIQSWISEQAEFSMLPQIISQELAREFGDAYVITPGGTLVGMDGQPADPWAVLIANGFQQPPQASPAPGNVPGQAALGQMSPTVAPLQPLQGTAQQSGAVL